MSHRCPILCPISLSFRCITKNEKKLSLECLPILILCLIYICIIQVWDYLSHIGSNRCWPIQQLKRKDICHPLIGHGSLLGGKGREERREKNENVDQKKRSNKVGYLEQYGKIRVPKILRVLK